MTLVLLSPNKKFVSFNFHALYLSYLPAVVRTISDYAFITASQPNRYTQGMPLCLFLGCFFRHGYVSFVFCLHCEESCEFQLHITIVNLCLFKKASWPYLKFEKNLFNVDLPFRATPFIFCRRPSSPFIIAFNIHVIMAFLFFI